MATTLLALRTACRKYLASTSDWSDAALDAFIQDAIRFYSAEFPKEWYHDISLTTGTQTYSLPAGLQKIIAVEYPTGEDPQSFIEPVTEWDDRFQVEDEVYALISIDDTTAAGSLTYHHQIKFAETVATGETARIHYFGDHAIPTAASDTDQITVPQAHWEALIAFVDFRCHAELEADTAVTVSTISIVLSQLGQEARDAWNKYKEIMGRLEHLEHAGKSAILDWQDLTERIY